MSILSTNVLNITTTKISKRERPLLVGRDDHAHVETLLKESCFRSLFSAMKKRLEDVLEAEEHDENENVTATATACSLASTSAE